MRQFPIINSFEDVAFAVDRDIFVVAEKDGYSVVDYKFSSPDTFPDNDPELLAMRKEFRGLIFNAQGDVVRRPYHKFFNVGERAEATYENISMVDPHIILEKLDGSMIAPFKINPDDGNGDIRWGTRMGETDVSAQVVKWLNETNRKFLYENFVHGWISRGYTPVFEWTSNTQKIVLDYPESNLILTALRNMHNGEYIGYTEMATSAKEYNIPFVTAFYGLAFSEEFLKYVKTVEDMEGFVVRFNDGRMYKVKGDWYCQLHRVKSDINYERGVVQLILDNKVDDLKPILPAEDKEKLIKYEHAFKVSLVNTRLYILSYLAQLKILQMTRKEFALGPAENFDKFEKGAIFKFFDEQVPENEAVDEYIKSYILSNCGRNVKFDIMRENCSIFSKVPKWNPVMFDTDSAA